MRCGRSASFWYFSQILQDSPLTSSSVLYITRRHSTKLNSMATKKDEFDRNGLEDLMKRRFIIAPAFQIYSGVAGLFDYGPVGCAIKANLIALWRQHFVLNEDMLEVDCTALTPLPVLE